MSFNHNYYTLNTHYFKQKALSILSISDDNKNLSLRQQISNWSYNQIIIIY